MKALLLARFIIATNQGLLELVHPVQALRVGGSKSGLRIAEAPEDAHICQGMTDRVQVGE